MQLKTAVYTKFLHEGNDVGDYIQIYKAITNVTYAFLFIEALAADTKLVSRGKLYYSVTQVKSFGAKYGKVQVNETHLLKFVSAYTHAFVSKLYFQR